MGGNAVGAHAYGKLPAAGDFIHFRLDGEESRGFKDWMDRGHALVEAIRRGGAEPPRQDTATARRYRFVLDPGGSRKLIVGVVLESHDRGRLRWFPFAVFAEIDGAPFRERPALLPLFMQEGCEVLDRGVQAAQEAADTDDVSRRLADVAVESPGPWGGAAPNLDALLASTPSGALWEGLWPGASREKRLVLVDLLVRALQPFRSKRPEEAAVAFKFPLRGHDAETRLQCAFWIEWVARMLPGARQAPNLFVEVPWGGGAPTALHLFPGKADDKNFASLFTRSYETEYVNDLTDPPAVLAGSAKLDPAARRLLDNDAATLTDLVRGRWM